MFLLSLCSKIVHLDYRKYSLNCVIPLLNGFHYPKVIATTVKNLLLVELGLIMSFPTIVIAATTGKSNGFNRHEMLSFTSTDASWIGEY